MNRIIIAALSVLLLSAAGNTDWKWLGGTDTMGGPAQYYYESKGVQRLPDKHIQVWLKALNSQDVIAEKPSRAVLDQAANRLRHHYIPPVMTLESAKKDNLLNVLFLEAIANEGAVEARIEILMDLDCQGQISRPLTTVLHTPGSGGDITTNNKPGPWAHSPPESMGASLLLLLCK